MCDELCNAFECEEHTEESESCWEEKEQDGEDDCPQEELLHGAVSTVHSVPEGVVLLPYEKSPESNNTFILGQCKAPGISIKTVDMDGEEHEQVPEEGDLYGKSGVAGNTDYGCEMRGEEGDDKHDIGHPEVDMVEKEVS